MNQEEIINLTMIVPHLKLVSSEKKREYNKTYNDKNKDSLFKISYICEICGGKYKKINRKHHYNTKKHQRIMNTLLINE